MTRPTECAVLGLLVVTAGCGSPTPPAAGGSSLPATPAQFAAGETLYDANCGSCHDSSRDGSPRLGFLRVWAKRIEQGEPVLVQHAIEGIGLMPPRGDNPDLSDEDIASVVAYMVYRAKLDIPAKH